jgi:uncharacterized membrane protein YcfT
MSPSIRVALIHGGRNTGHDGSRRSAEGVTQHLDRDRYVPPWSEEPTQPLPALTAARAGWADVAKGSCILLVVLWHVIMKHYLQIDWDLPAPIPGAWGMLGDQLLPLRMPVFFTISGFLAATAAARPWRVVARGRIARFYYLYVIWFVVHTTVLALVPDFDTLAARTAMSVLAQLTITPTNLWYLLALAVYFVIAKLTRTVPAAVVLVSAFLLSATASAGWLAAPGNRGQLYQNLFFFLAGLRLKAWIEQWARRANLPVLLAGGTAYLLVMLAIRASGAGTWFGVRPAVSVLAVLVGIAAAVQLERLRPIARGLIHLGRSTLPIYVIHMPLLALLHAALLDAFSGAGTPVQILLAVTLPAALTALLVTVCLTLHRWLTAVGATWLFGLPRRREGATTVAGAGRATTPPRT